MTGLMPVATIERKETIMRKILGLTLLALCFTTGFTCSKQTPDAVATTTPPPAELPVPTQEQMAAPATPPADPAAAGAAAPAPADTTAPAAATAPVQPPGAGH